MCCGKPNKPVLTAKQKEVLSTDGFVTLNYHGERGITWQGAPSRRAYRTDTDTLMVAPIDLAWFLSRFDRGVALFTIVEPVVEVATEPIVEIPSFAIEAEPLEIDVTEPDAIDNGLEVVHAPFAPKRTRKKIQE